MERDYRGYLKPECSSCPYWLDGSTWDLGCGYHDACTIEYAEPHITNEKRHYKYSYNGPVMIFDQCVTNHWHGETRAVSERKARSNLLYQWKRDHGFAINSKVSLPGRVIFIG